MQARPDAFARRWRVSYPAAVRCLLDDRESLTVYLRFPREHWTRVRHSNFEGTFGETRRRVKVIGRLPANTPACRWSGRCSTEPRPAGAGSPRPRPGCGCCRICAGRCTPHPPRSTRVIVNPAAAHEAEVTLSA
jgi:hypothetical protein